MNVLHLAICTEYEGMEELITLISEKLMYRQVHSFENLVENTLGQRRAAERWNGVRIRTRVAAEFSRARSNTCDETVSLLGELFSIFSFLVRFLQYQGDPREDQDSPTLRNLDLETRKRAKVLNNVSYNKKTNAARFSDGGVFLPIWDYI